MLYNGKETYRCKYGALHLAQSCNVAVWVAFLSLMPRQMLSSPLMFESPKVEFTPRSPTVSQCPQPALSTLPSLTEHCPPCSRLTQHTGTRDLASGGCICWVATLALELVDFGACDDAGGPSYLSGNHAPRANISVPDMSQTALQDAKTVTGIPEA